MHYKSIRRLSVSNLVCQFLSGKQKFCCNKKKEKDNTADAIESAQNQLRSMDFEEILDILDYIVNPSN